MCSLDNVRRFWLCIRGRKKFVPSVHAGVPGSDRGSHRRGTCQAEGAREEESGRRGRNAAVFFFHPRLKKNGQPSSIRKESLLAGRLSGFFFSNLHFRSIQIHKFSIQLFMHTFYMIGERFHSTFLLRSKKCFVFNSFDQTIQIGLWIIINFEEVQFRWCHLIRGNFVPAVDSQRRDWHDSSEQKGSGSSWEEEPRESFLSIIRAKSISNSNLP